MQWETCVSPLKPAIEKLGRTCGGEKLALFKSRLHLRGGWVDAQRATLADANSGLTAGMPCRVLNSPASWGMLRRSAVARAGTVGARLPPTCGLQLLPNRIVAFPSAHDRAGIACRLSYHEGGFPSFTSSSGAPPADRASASNCSASRRKYFAVSPSEVRNCPVLPYCSVIFSSRLARST